MHGDVDYQFDCWKTVNDRLEGNFSALQLVGRKVVVSTLPVPRFSKVAFGDTTISRDPQLNQLGTPGSCRWRVSGHVTLQEIPSIRDKLPCWAILQILTKKIAVRDFFCVFFCMTQSNFLRCSEKLIWLGFERTSMDWGFEWALTNEGGVHQSKLLPAFCCVASSWEVVTFCQFEGGVVYRPKKKLIFGGT